VAGESVNKGLFRGILNQLRILIVVVNIVADSEKLLPTVAACDEYSCHTNDVGLLNLGHVGRSALKNELHLARLNIVHLGFLEDLVLVAVRSLADVDDPPCQSAAKGLQGLKEDLKAQRAVKWRLRVVSDNVDHVHL
jgi:hypothetical protein